MMKEVYIVFSMDMSEKKINEKDEKERKYASLQLLGWAQSHTLLAEFRVGMT